MTNPNTAVNLDAFDDEDANPIVLKFAEIPVENQEKLELVLASKRRTELLRTIRKIMLGLFATLITLVLALT